MTLAILLACSLALPQTVPTVPDTLRIQVMLDRAGFSPGAIDGRMGPSTRRALEVYRKQIGESPQQPFEPLTRYRITPDDVAGPFVENIPADLVEQGNLPYLGYRSVVEALAERFHATPALLQQLNKGARFSEGEDILVPNVEPLAIPSAEDAKQAPPPGRGRGREGGREGSRANARGATGTAGRSGAAAPADVVVTVSKSASALTVADPSGRILLYAPVTTGSENDPLPIGEWKVNGVSLNPTFNYNPELFWDADPSHSKAKIPPGPNNPVGLVWIDLSKEHYGIHGTPEPTQIGKSESHGCVRMTNWDALKLAGLVRPGTRVVFTE